MLKHYPCVSLLCSSSKLVPHSLNNSLFRKPHEVGQGTPFLGSQSVGRLPRRVLQMPRFTSPSSDKRRPPLQAVAVASLGGLLGGIFKGTDTGESARQQYAPTVSLINGFEAQMSSLSDLELRDKTRLLKQRAQLGESLDSLLPVSVTSSIFPLYSLPCFSSFRVASFEWAASWNRILLCHPCFTGHFLFSYVYRKETLELKL